MGRTMEKITFLIAGLVLACFWPASTHAQAEGSPDAYESKKAEPEHPAPSVKAEFQGNFSLPFQAQCGGHKLAPGKYTLMVKTVGESKMVTLQQDGNEIVLPVHRTTSPASASGRSVVMLRHGPGPGSRTLEGLYLEKLNLELYLDESGHTKAMDKMFAGVKRVPIS
jgi:hypothetical protein